MNVSGDNSFNIGSPPVDPSQTDPRDADASAGQVDSVADERLGARLKAARERRGLSVADVAERLRLRSRIISAIEDGDTDHLGAEIYVRGYLLSYARLVELPLVAVEHHLTSRTPSAPPLVVTTRRSHVRWLADRYARRAGHILLTAAIVVPVILLATYDQLPNQRAALTPLDPGSSPEREQRAVGVDRGGQRESIELVGPPSPGDGESTPVMASITPFYRDNGARSVAPQSSTPPHVTDAVAPPEPGAAPAQGLRLNLREASWVEVVADDGSQLAYGLLQPGTEHTFDVGRVARVALGNADGVDILLNGKPLDLAPYRRANVARFTLQDSRPVPSGG